MNHPPASHLFNHEADYSLPDLEFQRQSYLAKFTIGILDPMPERIRCERGHVARHDRINQLTNGFALFLRMGMQSP